MPIGIQHTIIERCKLDRMHVSVVPIHLGNAYGLALPETENRGWRDIHFMGQGQVQHYDIGVLHAFQRDELVAGTNRRGMALLIGQALQRRPHAGTRKRLAHLERFLKKPGPVLPAACDY